MAMDLMPTVLLCFATSLTLFLNGFIIFVIIRRKRLKTPVTMPSSILYIALAVTDIMAALFWTLPTAIHAVTGSTEPISEPLCKIQVVFMIFCNLMNGYILAAFMFERFLRFFKPSKQKEIFFDFVVLIFIGALTFFHGVIAAFPVWGFGKIEYFPDQYQCAVDFPWSESHYRFTMVMEYCLPYMLILTFFIAVQIRLCRLRKHRAKNGDIIVEENLQIVGDSYSDRLKDVYARFKDAGSRSVKPKVKDENQGYNHAGYINDDDEFNSSDEEKDNTGPNNDRKDAIVAKPKKSYYLARSDVHSTTMYFVMGTVYFGLWVPYVAWITIYTYYYYEIPVSKTFTTAAVVASHFSGVLKFPCYLLSAKMRAAFGKTLCSDDRKKAKTAFDDPNAVKPEQTTEL